MRPATVTCTGGPGGAFDPRWLPGALHESKARVLDSLNVGYNMAIHVGHGYRNVMSVADGNIENNDMMNKALLHIGGKPYKKYRIYELPLK